MEHKGLCHSLQMLSASQITQSSNQVRSRLISQLIKGISRVFQKWIKYFNLKVISKFPVPSLSTLFANVDLNLNDLKSVISLSSGSFLQYCNKLSVLLA